MYIIDMQQQWQRRKNISKYNIKNVEQHPKLFACFPHHILIIIIFTIVM